MSSMIVSLLRRRLPILVLVALAAALVVLPAVASEMGQTVNAYGGEEYLGKKYRPYWSPEAVKVESGGHVTFANGSTTVKHGIVWTGPMPTCDAGVPVGAGNSKTSWSGTCTFSQPGEYTFYCSFHGPEMSGKVIVSAGGTITPGPTSPSPEVPIYPPAGSGGSGGSGTEGSSGSGGGSPFAGGSHALKLAAAQHGPSVHGSLDVSSAGAGGRLEVVLLASGASLAKTHRHAPVRVGRLLRSSIRAGIVSFAVPLSARGRSALHRHHRLVLTVRTVLAPVSGAAATMTRTVVLHG